jgi:hypothetical protein
LRRLEQANERYNLGGTKPLCRSSIPGQSGLVLYPFHPSQVPHIEMLVMSFANEVSIDIELKIVSLAPKYAGRIRPP